MENIPINTAESDTHRKGLRLNLDTSIYGTVAEVGAGQEVARWLFQVGGASGTVAKSISAYDMKVSDEIYGASPHYVSRDRLEQMLDHEYDLLVSRLGETRGANTAFFAFANTVSALNYFGTNILHGWVGLRFQTEPGTPYNDVILHINLKDETNLRQQQALGILGVNLIYGCFYLRDSLDDFLTGLIDSLSTLRVEVDFIDCQGPAFENIDHHSACIKLVRLGLAHAVVFHPDKGVVEPLSVLYKRPVVIERGSFRSARPIFAQMLEHSAQQLAEETPETGRDPVALLEISIHNLLAKITENDTELIERVERLNELGQCVMISDFRENFQLTEYLIRFTKAPIRLVMGIATLVQLFQETYYETLDGGIVEAMGRLIARNVRIYAYTMSAERFKRRLASFELDHSFWDYPESGPVTVDNILPKSHLQHLYIYLREIKAFIPLLLWE
ncbi:TonB-dependent receptor [Chloroflexota bacterium]